MIVSLVAIGIAVVLAVTLCVVAHRLRAAIHKATPPEPRALVDNLEQTNAALGALRETLGEIRTSMDDPVRDRRLAERLLEADAALQTRPRRRSEDWTLPPTGHPSGPSLHGGQPTP